MKIRIGSYNFVIGTVASIGVAIVAVSLLGAAGIKGWEYSNSNEFCAAMCHDVHPEEIAAHKQGAHARVNCVECHMGRNSTLHLMALKPTHVKELWGMIVGYERPITSGTLRPSREACESCHYPAVEHHDSVAVKVQYGTDPQSSESRTKLVLHTGMDAVRPGYTRGIHWHIQNEVRFVSPDPQRREIPWVEVVKPDGTKVAYTDASTKLSAQQIAALPARPMACYDCHNEVGHPFANPATTVDEAIRTGKIDRSLSNTKARALALIDKLPEITGETKAREAKIDAFLAEAAAKAGTAGRVQAGRAEVQCGDARDPARRVVPGEGLLLADLPQPHGSRRHARLLPLPRRQALQRQGRGHPPAVHAVPRLARGDARERQGQRGVAAAREGGREAA